MVGILKRLFLFTALAAACASCSVYDFGGMIAAGSSVQQRFKNSMSESERDFYPENVVCGEAGYRFLVATDMHIKDGDWNRVGDFMAMAGDGNSLITLLLGDYMYEAGTSLGRLADTIGAYENLTVFPAIGNHEVYKDGYDKTYRCVFGPTCYFFKVVTPTASDLFIVLDSANGTLGIDQFGWLQSLLSEFRASCRHCFIFTHANFFGPPGNVDLISTYPVEEQMKLLNVFSSHDVTAVFTGHSHKHDETTVRGVKYITLDPWKNREYGRIECLSDGNVAICFEKMP